MSKYAMLNCWDDLNKGDLGIMLSLATEIRRQDSGCEIIGISSFCGRDPLFQNGHILLKKYVTDVFPAIFGALGISILGSYKKNTISKLLCFITESIRYYLCMITPKAIGKRILTNEERRTLEQLMECNCAISKGGTLFTDFNTVRGAFALRRVCRFYKLLKHFGIKYYIIGQSFGPISNRFCLKMTNRIIKDANIVFLRERKCISEYPSIDLTRNNVAFSNDVAFLMDSLPVKDFQIDTSKSNVGMTIRCMPDDSLYLQVISEVINTLVIKEKAYVHIFRQVAMESEPDNKTAETILKRLNPKVREYVIYHRDNYLPQELCWMYGQMDFFIGTRLHSTIFAMVSGIPTIGISYQGTKTQGIFDNIGVSELAIIGDISASTIIGKIHYIRENRNEIEEIIRQGVSSARVEMSTAIAEIIEESKSS